MIQIIAMLFYNVINQLYYSIPYKYHLVMIDNLKSLHALFLYEELEEFHVGGYKSLQVDVLMVKQLD